MQASKRSHLLLLVPITLFLISLNSNLQADPKKQKNTSKAYWSHIRILPESLQHKVASDSKANPQSDIDQQLAKIQQVKEHIEKENEFDKLRKKALKRKRLPQRHDDSEQRFIEIQPPPTI